MELKCSVLSRPGSSVSPAASSAARTDVSALLSQVESSQEANAEVMREMTRKLYSQYEERMREEEQRHKAEKEMLLVRTASPGGRG